MRPAVIPPLPLIVAVVLGALLAGCGYGYAPPPHQPLPPARFALAAPRFEPPSAQQSALAVLGRQLFNDTRLSGDGTMSCATCHQPDRGFADGRPVALGAGGQTLARHTPSLWNIGLAPRLMVDGRAATLEEQALMPIQNPAEMNADIGRVVAVLQGDAAMRRQFAAAFPGNGAIGAAGIAAALAAYQRTLVSRPARFDRWAVGDSAALSMAEVRGYALFSGRAGCARCHSGPAFSDGGFHDIGLPDSDLGRGAITGRRRDDHGFRTPSLREIGRSAPYMHNGALADLAAVVDHYADRIVVRPGVPARVVLNAQDRSDLVAFLRALDSETAAPGA